MLIRLLRTHLRPYKRQLGLIVVLQAIQTAAALTLPGAQRRHHRQGRAPRGHGLHPVARGAHARRSPSSRWCSRSSAVRVGARVAMGFGRDLRANLFHQVTDFSAREVGHVRCPVAHHPHHQRRAAGADARGHGLHHGRGGTDHDRGRRGHGAAAGRRTVDRAGGRACPFAAIVLGIARQPDGAGLPQDAGPDRPDQPGAPRADHRHPRRARLRPRTRGDRPVRRRQRRPHRHRPAGRPADVVDVPRRQPADQRLERGGALDRRQPGRHRRPAGRLPDRVPQLPGADPDVGGHGHVHHLDGPSGRRVRRPDPRGARHRLLGRPSRRAGAGHPAPRHPRDAGRGLPLPGRRGAGAHRHHLRHRGRAHHGHRRQHRCRQDHPRQPRAAALRRHLGRGARRRRRRARARARPALGLASGSFPRSRTSSPAPSPATSSSASPTPPRPRCGRPSRSPRRPTSCGDMPGQLQARIEQGGTNVSGGQRQRLVHRPRARAPPVDLPVRRLVLGPRPHHRRPRSGPPSSRTPRRRRW